MKHFFLLMCCALSGTILFAQSTTTWFPPGAKWQFHYGSISGPGLEILERVGMETFEGHLCAKLHYYGYHSGWPAGPADYGYEYLYAEQDSVFWWNGSSFQLLYDFTRQAGDAFTLYNSLYDSGVVDSTGITVRWDVAVRFQDLSLFSVAHQDTLKRRVYEGLGGQQHLLYWDNGSPLAEIDYGLSCYRDDEHPDPDCKFGYDPDYEPFPDMTATWSEEDGSFCGYHGFQYKMEGDTSIPGVGQGKKIYSRNTYAGTLACPTPSSVNLQEPFRFMGILSQNIPQKKIFFTRLGEDPVFPICVSIAGTDQFPLQQPVLLYDFDLAVGDTIAWRNEPNIVLSIDSIQLKDNTWRRTFHFDDQQYYFWIEGIGSSLGLFNAHAMQATDIGCSLRCYRENNQLLYPRALASDVLCDSVLVATSNPADLGSGVQLYPNPASGTCTLEVAAGAVPALARLFDAQGREVDRREITGAITQWKLPETGASKVLFMHLQTPDGRSAGRVLRLE